MSKPLVRFIVAAIGWSALATAVLADSPPAQSSEAFGLSDIPKEFKLKRPDQDYTRRVEMIPMRDGVKLQTIIFVPKGAQNAPIILTRTPYDAAGRSHRSDSMLLLIQTH